ncbi:MAG: hypothetical protein ACP5TY_05040 [Thermodesulforhabdaceae bacterium]
MSVSKNRAAILALIILSGCAHLGLSTISLKSPDVLISTDDVRMINSSIICVVPFSSRENITGPWLGEITRAYVRAIQVRNIGALVRYFDTQRDFLVERKSCHLVIEGSVDRLLFTGGGQPQEMIVSVQVRDLTTEQVIFSLRQEGIAGPGRDVDLYWTTVEGQRAAPARKLIDSMSDQFGKLLMDEILKSSRKSV